MADHAKNCGEYSDHVNFETTCSKQFIRTLQTWLSSKNFQGSEQDLVVKKAYEAQQRECNGSHFLRGLIQNNGETARKILETIHGMLLVVNISTEKCVHVELSTKLPLSKLNIVGKSIRDVLHPQNQSYFISRLKESEDGRIESAWLTTRFLVKPVVEEATDEVFTTNAVKENYITMNCMRFVESFKTDKAAENMEGDKDDEYVLCLATLRQPENASDAPPPNHTIHSRDEIPRPDKFYTLQDLQGNICAVSIDVTTLFKCPRHSLPADKKDLVRRCLKSFMESKSNGLIIRDAVLKEVMSKGQTTSPRHRFLLPGGVVATSIARSELKRTSQGGGRCFILSVHLVYREGNIRGINLQGLPTPIQAIISGVAGETSSCSTATTSVTTTTTSSSQSPSYFLSSKYHPSPNMSIGSYSNDSSVYASPWQSQARKNYEVTDLLANVVKTSTNMESINDVLSPPPHLDGHLVHTVGARNTPAAINKCMAASPDLNSANMGMFGRTTNFTNTAACGQSAMLAQQNVSNPSLHPGPPCVDLGRLDMVTNTSPAMSSSAVASTLTSGVTTQAMQTVIATRESLQFSNMPMSTNTEKSYIISPESAFSFDGAGPNSDKSNSSSQCSPPKRPRSAFTNTTAATSVSLKRSASTMSEDSGIGEMKTTPPQFKRSTSKDKSKIGKNAILTQLLLREDSSDGSQSSMTSTTTSARQVPTKPIDNFSTTSTASPLQNGLFSPTANSLPIAGGSPMRQNPQNIFQNQSSVCKTGQGYQLGVSSPQKTIQNIAFNSNNGLAPNVRQTTSVAQTYSVSTEVSAEEMRELSEIFDDCSDLWLPQADAPNRNQRPLTEIALPDISAGIAQSGVLSENFNSFANSVVPNNMQNSLQRPTGFQEPSLPRPDLLSTPDLMPSSVPNNLGCSSYATQQISSFSNQGQVMAGPVCVPTGQETCPNRMVGGNQLVHKLHQPQASMPQLREFNMADNWEGKEPLVDLGANPPPGINPRMSIPVPSRINPALSNGVTPVRVRNPHYNAMLNQQVGVNKMPAFQNPNIGMNPSLHMNHPHQLENPNANMTGSISPNNFISNISSGGDFSPAMPNSILYSAPQPYNNGAQRGMTVTTNVRPALLRKQLRPVQMSFHGNMNANGGVPPRYSYSPARPRIPQMIVQRRGGTILNTRNPSPVLMQRTISSPSGQNPYTTLNSTQLRTGSPSMGSYSPLKTPGFSPNAPLLPDRFGSPMSYDPSAVGPASKVTSQPQNHFNSGMSATYNGMTSYVDNFPGNVINSVAATQPVAKQPVKRPRNRKSRKNSKTKSFDEPSIDDSSPSGYKQRPLLQMTIGDVHHRPQSFKSSLDEAFPNSSQRNVTATNMGGLQQTWNLNSLMNQPQNQSQNGNQLCNDVLGFPDQQFPSHNTNNLSWSVNDLKQIGSDVCVTSSDYAGGMLPNVLSGRSQTNTSNSFIQSENNNNMFMNGSVSNPAMNSNLNNNNFSDVSKSASFTTVSSNPKRTTLLEQLLLS